MSGVRLRQKLLAGELLGVGVYSGGDSTLTSLLVQFEEIRSVSKKFLRGCQFGLLWRPVQASWKGELNFDILHVRMKAEQLR